MILRVLRPQRAQRLISPIWTRAFASQTEPNPTPEQKDASPPENAAAGRLRVLRMKGGIRDPPSKLHWVLSDIYTEGGKLPSTPNRDVNTAVEDTRDYLGRKIPLWGKKQVSLRIRTGEEGSRINFQNFWLRDNCRCKACVNQNTMQRAFETFSIPKDIMPNEVSTEAKGLRIVWNHENHESLYPWSWIEKQILRRNLPLIDKKGVPFRSKEPDPQIHWGSEIAANPPSVHYDEIMTTWREVHEWTEKEIMASDRGVGKWTEKIRKYGFCYVDGCPTSPKRTKDLLRRIAFVRRTHYGGFYDFTADLDHKDTAYTNLALPAHTDNTYFTDPAGLQMFHLLSHEEGSGGASILVDGFHAAAIFKQEASLEKGSGHYAALSSIPVSWHASGNEGITISPSEGFPVLNHTKDGKLQHIRWNDADRGEVSPMWYGAARRFDEILKRESMEYWAQLEPGRPLIFDNWRVLHGRSAFTGIRRMCGGYINRDDYVSRWLNTNYTREEALEQVL